MTGVVRKATFLAVLGLAATMSVAMAGVPSPANCTLPTSIQIGGCDGLDTIDPNIYFSVTIRDIGNFPVVNQPIACGFNTDFRIYNGEFPGFVSCQCVEAVTDINGVATFRVAGSGLNTNGVAGYTGALAATFYGWNCGNALVIGQANVAAYDENGAVTTKGVEISDLSAWIADYNVRAVPPVRNRSDFTGNGAVDISDLSFWIRVYNTQLSRYTCGTLCL